MFGTLFSKFTLPRHSQVIKIHTVCHQGAPTRALREHVYVGRRQKAIKLISKVLHRKQSSETTCTPCDIFVINVQKIKKHVFFTTNSF